MKEADIALLAQRMQVISQSFRASSPPTPHERAAGVLYLPTRYRGVPVVQPLVWLATLGCSRYHVAGGCTMCDFGAGGAVHPLSDAELEAQLRPFARVPMLHLAVSGSFFDDSEMPLSGRDTLLTFLAKTSIEVLGVESRPEHISGGALGSAIETIGRNRMGGCLREFSVGVGIEAFDPLISLVALNKGFDRRALLPVLETARSAEDMSGGRTKVAVEAHVLVGAPLIDEAKAVEDAVEATEWALEVGADRVILMAGSIKERTLWGWLFQEGHEHGLPVCGPPSLWSVVEVIKRVSPAKRPRLRVYGFTSNIPAAYCATSCPECSSILLQALMNFNFTGSSDAIAALDVIKCTCKTEWLRRMDLAGGGSLKSRLATYVSRLEDIWVSGA